MTEETALTKDFDSLPVSNVDDATLQKLTERTFLPYIKFLVGTSAEAESGAHKAGEWIFCRGKDNVTPLTNSWEGLVVASRPRACRKTQNGILNFYDMDSEEYKKVEVDAAKDGMTGSWHGTEFLVWVRGNRSWAVFHASSETNRSRSGELVTMLLNWKKSRMARKDAKEKGLPESEWPVERRPQTTFKSIQVEYKSVNKKGWAPVFGPCTTPFSEYPTMQEIVDQTTKFLNPPKKDVETVAAGTDAGTQEGRG